MVQYLETQVAQHGRSLREGRTNGLTLCVLLAAIAFSQLNSRAATWLTDLPSAQATAKAENKLLLINFTGSDWCAWCMRLHNEVFSKPEFDAYASQNLVLVEADFPRHKEQSLELKQANSMLQRRFHIEGYPTIIVLNSQGEQIGTLGYHPGGTEAFIASLNKIAGRPTSPALTNQAEVAPPPPLFNGAQTFPPQQFGELVLKGLSGPAGKRLALINNETFAVGDTTKLKLSGKEVKVKCLEIRQDSALVSIDGGDPKEVRMP